MRRMWRDKRLVLSNEYLILRCFSREFKCKSQEPRPLLGVLEKKSQEQRYLLNVKAVWEHIERGLNSWKDGFSRSFRVTDSLLSIPFIALMLLIGSCNSDVKQTAEQQQHQQYTCSMHPQIVENEPGSCPICGMDLTPIRGHHSTHSVDSLLAIGNGSDTTTETIIVKESSYAPELSMSGSVTYNTNQVKSISARVSGRIEKSYVKYNFEPVKKGQLLLKVYSAELVAIQQELLFLKSKGDNELLNQTKAKLSLLGVSTPQINDILQTGKADYTVNIYSNYSGYLLNPEANNDGNLQSANNPLTIREGQYINSGDLLFKVFNDSSLWAEFYTNTLESDWLKVGTELSLKIGEQNTKNRINFIQPFFKNNQNYKIIRVALNNQKHQYKIGELATANLKHATISGLWVSQQSVYQSGEKNLVFIKTEKGLKTKEVQISAKAESQILITKGLTQGDEIVKNASYLTDSESFINSK